MSSPTHLAMRVHTVCDYGFAAKGLLGVEIMNVNLQPRDLNDFCQDIRKEIISYQEQGGWKAIHNLGGSRQDFFKENEFGRLDIKRVAIMWGKQNYGKDWDDCPVEWLPNEPETSRETVLHSKNFDCILKYLKTRDSAYDALKVTLGYVDLIENAPVKPVMHNVSYTKPAPPEAVEIDAKSNGNDSPTSRSNGKPNGKVNGKPNGNSNGQKPLKTQDGWPDYGSADDNEAESFPVPTETSDDEA